VQTRGLWFDYACVSPLDAIGWRHAAAGTAKTKRPVSASVPDKGLIRNG
jgi:hypothetical protein